jgi:hypothetical protein
MEPVLGPAVVGAVDVHAVVEHPVNNFSRMREVSACRLASVVHDRLDSAAHSL